MRIRLIGQRNNSGIGTHYACFADALKTVHGFDKLVEEVDFADSVQMQAAIDRSQPGDINISFVGTNIQGHFRGTIIQWIVFESTRVPEILLPCLHAADQIWVPSAWGQRVLIVNGVPEQKIRVVPEGVDRNRFHAHHRRPYKNDRVFRFLSVGKYEQRKSMDETIEAFAQTYANHDSIELVIKSNYFTNHDAKLQALQHKINSLKLTNVRVLWGDMTPDQIVELYQSCDIFVLPSRAEAWGLPLIEAVASGMPVITTDYSGHMEFLQHASTSVMAADHVMVDIACPEYRQYYPNANNYWGQWARPDIYAIGAIMQTMCREYHQGLYQQAQENSIIIRDQFEWARSADLAIKCIKEFLK